jgi:hypothetical protein
MNWGMVHTQRRSNDSDLVPRLGHLKPVRSKLTGLLSACIAASSLLLTAEAALAQSAEAPMDLKSVQHLVCVKEAQHFICDPQSAEQSTNDAAEDESANKTTEPSYLISPQRDRTISYALLGVLYFGLPIAVALTIWALDKKSKVRKMTLKAQIDLLERIWEQNPQR